MTVGFQDTDTREQDISEAQVRLDEILGRSLNAHNINTYADEALSDLVLLVDGIVTTQKYEFPLSDIENERRALKTAGLDPDTVELTLDHIANVAESTRRLDAFIMKKTKLVDRVLVPPDSDKTKEITPGDGSFEKPKERIPKLKTLLLLLETEFDINLNDEDELPPIIGGRIDSDMMRSTSYQLVQIPALERTVLVCDEVGNTTFVFDQARCDRINIKPHDLYEMTKDQQRDLIKELQIGVQIDYSMQYVDRLAKALGVSLNEFDETQERDISILKPKPPLAPKGYLSAGRLAKELGVSHTTILNAIFKIREDLGEVRQYRFTTRVTEGYSPSQVDKITAVINLAPGAPDGYLSESGIYKTYEGAGPNAINNAIAELHSVLGEVRLYRFGSQTTYGYSPDQVQKIIDYLQLAPLAPEQHMTIYGISQSCGISRTAIRRAVQLLGESLGEAREYRFKGGTATGYSPDQIKIIVGKIEEMRAPEGYLTATGIYKKYGVAGKVIQRVAEELGDKLGETLEYLFGSVTSIAYSPDQQRKIIEHVSNNNKKVVLGKEALALIHLKT